jgi:hypothetical protein
MGKKRDPATQIPPAFPLHSGNLAAFHEAMKRGEIPYGSVIHVERLSRLYPDRDRAIAILRGLLGCGLLVRVEDRDLLLWDVEADLDALLA